MHIKNCLYFLRYIRPHLDKYIISILVGICLQFALLLPPLVLKALFDYAFPLRDFKLVILFAFFPFAFTICLRIIGIVQSHIDLYLNQQIYTQLYHLLYTKLNRLPLHFFHRYQVGDLILRMTDDIQIVEDTTLKSCPAMLNAIVKLILLLSICFLLNAKITLLALVGIPFYFLETFYFSKKLKSVNKLNKSLSAHLYNTLEERLTNIKLIKLLHRWTHEVQSLLAVISRLFFVERKAKITSSFHVLTSSFINRGWHMVVMIYTGYLIINGQMSVGEVIAIMSYIVMLQGPFDVLFSVYTTYQTSQISFQRVLEILNYPEEEDTKNFTGKPFKFNNQLTFKNVVFSYTKADRIILNDISFSIKKGKSLAIVGKSGIGKSSILDLILRFYTPNSGTIAIDGTPINKIDLTQLRHNIGLISQDACLFYGSIRENITFGLEATLTEKEIIKVAQLADAHDFISALPDGYQSHVGPKGSYLSTGQRQRIAIARALIKNPDILIFDEATSALDSESENQIHKSIEKLKLEKTVIIIAHRLSTIAHVDDVIVLGHDGKIAEAGNFETLLKNKGLFHKLHELQVGGFHLFKEKANFLLKSSKRHNRKVSVSMLTINDFANSTQKLSKKALTHLLENLSLTIGLFTHESDLCTYDKNGIFWLIYPETSLTSAQLATARLSDYLNDVWFVDIPGIKLEAVGYTHEAGSEEKFETLSIKLTQQWFQKENRYEN